MLGLLPKRVDLTVPEIQPESRTPPVLLGSRPSAIPMLRISASGVPESKRTHLLREVFEPLGVRYEAKPVAGVPIEIDLTLRGLPGLQFFTGKMEGVSYRRIRQCTDPTDDACLTFNPRGQHAIAHRGREIVLGEGEATLLSLTEVLDFTNSPPGDFLVLRFPKRELASRLCPASRDNFMKRIPSDAPALRLLTSYVQIVQRDTADDSTLHQSIVSHFYDLMAVAIGATSDATEIAQCGGLRAARLHAIKREIADNLDQPNLSVAALAGKHGVTPRYVQRLFELEGTTFTEYVLAQRLARAHRLLTDPRRHGDKISAVAYDCGFNDVSYFNRAFRRRFAAAPSDVRAQGRLGNSASAS
jgi:AraC-like DNA-binding protein